MATAAVAGILIGLFIYAQFEFASTAPSRMSKAETVWYFIANSVLGMLVFGSAFWVLTLPGS